MALRYICLALLILAAVSAAPQTRLYGGQETTVQDHPYVAAFTYTYANIGITVQRCVGCIISSFHVLTTGFCYTGAVLENMHIRAGSTNSLTGGTLVTVARFEKAPTYSELPREGDIAVSFTSQPLFISSVIGIAHLPAAGYGIPDGTEGIVVSWGFDQDDVQLTNLKTIRLNKVNVDVCAALYENNENVVIDERVICASAPNVGTCNGDSGAPFVIDSIVFGIHSFHVGCGESEFPDVFTRVDQYTDWILGITASGSKIGGPVIAGPMVAY